MGSRPVSQGSLLFPHGPHILVAVGQRAINQLDLAAGADTPVLSCYA